MRRVVLVGDSEEGTRVGVRAHLEELGFRVLEARDEETCVVAAERQAPDVVLLGLQAVGLDGMAVLRRLRERRLDVPVVVMTSAAGVGRAVAATRAGADGYVVTPLEAEHLGAMLEAVLGAHRPRGEPPVPPASGYGELIGRAPAMQQLYGTLRRLERVDAPTVLIQGESGAGKDVVARVIHAHGPRKAERFLEIDCTSLPEHLIESELFGHERGAFTDAHASKRGLFELAAGGVVFLDEIGELPPALQAKLLRVLERRRFRRVGGVADLPFDAAVITATNRTLDAEVSAGRFRKDLYFRLNVVPIEVPPLRARSGDVPELVAVFVRRFAKDMARPVPDVSDDAMEILQRYAWPGNVRELRNVLERTLILLEGDVVRAADLPAGLRQVPQVTSGPGIVLPEGGVVLADVERSLVEQALSRTGGNRTQTARLLGLTRFALRARIEKFGIGLFAGRPPRAQAGAAELVS